VAKEKSGTRAVGQLGCRGGAGINDWKEPPRLYQAAAV